MRSAFRATTALIGALFGLCGTAAAQPTEDSAEGRVHYISSCSRCHGVLGAGGEGPPLARSELPRAPDDASLARIIRGGIRGTGMSASWWLSAEEVGQVIAYVRSLAPAGPASGGVLAGDPIRGRELYGEAGCTRCHTVGGFGTSRGPDLSGVGQRRGPAYIREAIVDPGATLPRGQTAMPSDFNDYLLVTIQDGSGARIRGTRVNEDSYTIQLRDGRGQLYSFEKNSVASIEKHYDQSLMRSYRDRLTEEEIDDIVSYLTTLQGADLKGIS